NVRKGLRMPRTAPVRRNAKRPATRRKPARERTAGLHAAALAELAAPRRRAALERRLLSWYDAHARDLPWRRTPDPYHVWVSEIMLQQAVVAAVVPYFERFIARFGTVADLARAPEEDVLRLWEGLGYYRRARQLHRAARVVCEEHAGRFPRDIE